MGAVVIPMADPQLEFHWLPDPGFLIQGFLIQGLRRSCWLGVASASASKGLASLLPVLNTRFDCNRKGGRGHR